MEMYKANDNRYADMAYMALRTELGCCLPAISFRICGIILVVWMRSVTLFRLRMLLFDNGITHFDLANNYGPVYGSAEENFGRILKKGLGLYRDELVIFYKSRI